MKKIWKTMVMLALSLVFILSAIAPALARDQDTESSASLTRGALAIIAPWSVPAGRDFTVRAFLRENQEPFHGAGVWAVSTDASAAMREDMARLNDGSTQNGEADYESVLNRHGSFLGRTGRDGFLACNIERPGRYILVVAKNGFQPGFTNISIMDTVKALGIRAPERVPAGQPVTMGVFDRITHEGVQGAGVWAITNDNMDALKQEAEALREDSSLTDEEKDYEAIARTYGFLLGRTDENGKLEYTFRQTGNYILVAVKRGYFPGFARLVVYDRPKALGITATPPQTQVSREVILDVFDRQSNNPVEGVGVWAVSRDEAQALRERLTAMQQDTSISAADKDYEAVVSVHGVFLGRTGPDGKLGASFGVAGTYLLVTAKRGYIPGFTTLVVREAPQIRPSKLEDGLKSKSRVVPEPTQPDQTVLK